VGCGPSALRTPQCAPDDHRVTLAGEHVLRDWAAKLEQDLLPIPYHHLVLTLPRPLTQLVMAHGDVLYSKLMQAGGRSILTVGDRLLGAQLGALCVLHSWGQKGNGHPHT